MEMNVFFPKILRAFDLKHFIKSLLLCMKKFPYGKHCFAVTSDNLNDSMFMIYLCRGKKKKEYERASINFMQSKPGHLQPLLL